MRAWVKDRFRSEEAGNFTRVRHHLVYGQQRRVGIRYQSITVRVGCITVRERKKRTKDGPQTGAQLNSAHITGISN
jgi:hypothetical protein